MRCFSRSESARGGGWTVHGIQLSPHNSSLDEGRGSSTDGFQPRGSATPAPLRNHQRPKWSPLPRCSVAGVMHPPARYQRIARRQWEMVVLSASLQCTNIVSSTCSRLVTGYGAFRHSSAEILVYKCRHHAEIDRLLTMTHAPSVGSPEPTRQKAPGKSTRDTTGISKSGPAAALHWHACLTENKYFVHELARNTTRPRQLPNPVPVFTRAQRFTKA